MKKIIKILTYIFLACVILYILFNNIYIYIESKRSVSEYNIKEEMDDIIIYNEEDNIEEDNKEEIKYSKIDISELKEKYNNKDIVAALEIENADYITPVVQTKNNDYYLSHNIERKKSYIGAIFLDYRVNVNEDKKLLIYGHNSYSYNALFKILDNYYDEDFLNNHKHVIITTNDKVRIYEVFSVYTETEDYSYIDINKDSNEFLKELKKYQKKSIYKIDTELNENTNILLLQTCNKFKEYKKYKHKFLIIVLKEI